MTALNGVIISPMTYSGASCKSNASPSLRSTAPMRRRAMISTRSVCCATEKICSPTVWPFQRATRARPCATSSISMSSGEGSRRSSRRPDSIRCHARGAPAPRLADGLLGFARDVDRWLRVTDMAILLCFGELGHRVVPVAFDHVVVDHTDRLHERVDDGRTDKLETATDEFFRQRTGHRSLGGNLGARAEAID